MVNCGALLPPLLRTPLLQWLAFTGKQVVIKTFEIFWEVVWLRKSGNYHIMWVPPPFSCVFFVEGWTVFTACSSIISSRCPEQLYASIRYSRCTVQLYPLFVLHRAAPFVFHLISLILERDVLSRETYCITIIRFHLITITLSVVVNIVVITTC